MNLRNLKIAAPVSEQSSVLGTPFDPIQERAAIIIFSATYCGPCTRMAPMYVQLTKQFPNVRPIVISQEDQKRLSHFYDKVKGHINYSISSISSDVWESLCNTLSVNGIPHATVLHNGKVLYNDHPAKPEYQQTIAALSELILKEDAAAAAAAVVSTQEATTAE